MSNANRVKITVEWRREDAKTYAVIPINNGKEGRPKFMAELVMELCFRRDWVRPWQVILYILNRDRAKMMEDGKELKRLMALMADGEKVG